MRTALLIISIVMSPLMGTVDAETHIGGWINGILEREGSPYICDLDDWNGIGVARGDTLTIEPGVTLLFPHNGTLWCEGVIVAIGTEEDSITFDAVPDDHWYGIFMADTTFDEIDIKRIEFSYCRFRNWVPLNDWGNYGLITVGSNDHKPVFRNCFFEGGPQILYSAFQVEFYDCYIVSGLTMQDIYLETRLPEVSIISGCVFDLRRCRGGIHLYNAKGTIIKDCLFLTESGYTICTNDSCMIANNIFYGSGFLIGLIYSDHPEYSLPVMKNNLFHNDSLRSIIGYSGDIDLGGFEILDRVNLNGDSTDANGNLFILPELIEEGNYPEFFFPGENSPCIDAGDPDSALDPDSTTNDIGPFFYPQCNIRVDSEAVEFVDIQTGTRVFEDILVRNAGLAPLTIDEITITSENNIFGFDFEWNDIAPDSSALITVYFNPPVEDSYEATLRIESNDRDQPVIDIPLSGNALSVGNDQSQQPLKFGITSISPNPFNATTEIEYNLPFSADVQVSIFDVSGREIIQLLSEAQSAGKHSLVWAGQNQQGSPVSSGVYFSKFTIKKENNVQYRTINRMVLLK